MTRCGAACWLLGLALCGITQAGTPPNIELSATPAWKGWSRPGRATEIEIRLSADSPVRTRLEVMAGRQTVRADLDLQPGRVLRLHIPVASTETATVTVVDSAASPAGPPQRRELRIAQSESPMLGVGLVTGEAVGLDGFHSVSLAADDLPRNASAYSSVDALILDAPTLAALDQRQLRALLAHVAACGRVVLLNADSRVRSLLDVSGGCGGQALMSAGSLTQARQVLESSLAVSLPKAMASADIGEYSRPAAQAAWNGLAAAVALYFAAALLALVFVASWPVWLLIPVFAALAVPALLHTMQPPSQLLVWSEGESGAQFARYQAWQQVEGRFRERVRVPIPPQLASAVRPCDPNQAMGFDFDADRGHAAYAEFETRLFHQVRLCYSGSFPMARAITIEAHPDGRREVRNAGTMAWPVGLLLAEGRVHDLPAVGAGAQTIVGAQAGRPPRDAVLQMAMARTRPNGVAALWALELGGVAGAPIESQGWLLVSVAAP